MGTRSLIAALLIATLVLAVPNVAAAHSGGLDAKGCHTNKKTGEYHCHRKQAEPESKQESNQATSSESSEGLVKMSKSGICHDSNSPWYEQTKNFTSFTSMQACIRAGGRPPKG